MMCTLTQRELDFLASLKTGWRRLYRRELMRLLKGDTEAARRSRRRARSSGASYRASFSQSLSRFRTRHCGGIATAGAKRSWP